MHDTAEIKQLSIDGLEQPVEIKLDPWGIAHIRAQTSNDLFFAQGWNAARDRLWQIDLWRKRGLGLLSADFGSGYLEQDRASRLFLFRGDMQAEWACYGPDSEAICLAFSRGINAYVDAVNQGSLPMPPEFALLGTRPSHWAADDVVRIRSHSLTRNATSEVLRARVMALAGAPAKGAELDALRKHLQPDVEVTAAEDFDLHAISTDILRDFNLAVSQVSFSRARLAARLEDAHKWTDITPLGDVVEAGASEGSNNWAVSAEKSATGRPILVLDPHRVHTLPSVRYVVHLSMPGFDAIGAGEPAVPGISMGHNGTVAFALTIFGADQEDVFVYETDPDDPLFYRYKDDFEPLVERVETIAVRGYPDQKVSLYFTRHGPVIHRDLAAGRIYAIRSVWTDPGMAPYMASLSVMRAGDFESYVAALKGWGTPSVNHIYADTSGTVGWKPSGATPLRPNWTGLLPVPGDGRFEWSGYLPPEAGPVEKNPERGFVATANAMNVPIGWGTLNPVIGYEWLDQSRADSIHQVLAESNRIGLEDCARLQCSTKSPIASRLLKAIALLRPFFAESGNLQPVLKMLSDWDGDLKADSVQAAIFEIWLSCLGPAIAKASGASDEMLPYLVPYDVQTITRWVERHVTLATDKAADLISATLIEAWQTCGKRMGRDPQKWSWGRVHALELKHPLQALVSENWSMRRIPLGGSSSTINYAGYRTSDFGVTVGPTVRMIIDVGGWDNSLFINTPGQSGVPGSEHYANLGDAWAECTYMPLLYSQEAVDAAARTIIRCTPQSQ